MNNHKYKYLLTNIGLLTVSSFATKLLTFFLVPLYTYVLTTSEYGTYDIFNTTISLLFPILTADITEAVLRFALDKDIDSNSVISIGIKISAISSIIIAVVVIINNIFSINKTLQEFGIQFFLMYVTTTFSSVLSYYARGIDQIKHLSISGIISSAVSIVCNIYFLLFLKIGLQGYFYATILGAASQIVYLFFTLKLRPIRIASTKSEKLLRNDMLKYSTPMIANAVSWWVNNASDRYVVTWLSGIAANGIYSVSYKIPSIINVIQNIFGQAWSISAVNELDKNDTSHFYINVYNIYNFILVFSCSALIAFNKFVAKILFAKDFFNAWEYSPFLLISVIFSGMSAFIGGLFTALKDSKTFAKTSVITAVINTIGNIFLVLLMGPLGAAVSTAFAYFIMWVLRILEVKKTINLRVNFKRDLLAYGAVVVQAILLLCTFREKIFSFYQFIFPLIVLILYRSEAKAVIKKIKR